MLSLARTHHSERAQAEASFGISLQQFQRENGNVAASLFCSSQIMDSPEAVADIHVHQSSLGAAYLQRTLFFFFSFSFFGRFHRVDDSFLIRALRPTAS